MAKRTNKELIAELRRHRESARPFSVWDLSTGLSAEKAKRVETILQEKFHLWWDSWIGPLVDEIEGRLVGRRKTTKVPDGYSLGNTTRLASQRHLVKNDPFNFTAICGVQIHEASLVSSDSGGEVCQKCERMVKHGR